MLSRVVLAARTILTAAMCAVVLLTAGCGGGLEQRANGMVDSMVKGDFAEVTKEFDANMNSIMSSEKLGQVWSTLGAQVGPFKSRTGNRETQEGGYRCEYVTCEFEKASREVEFVFDNEGQVSGLWIRPVK